MTKVPKGSRPKLQCPGCSHRSREGYNFNRHWAKMHSPLATHPGGPGGAAGRAIECCGQVFLTKYAAFKHRKEVHGGGVGYVCSVCAESFPLPARLKRHMRVHTGEKPYRCMKCGYETSNKSNLVRHKRSKRCLHNEDPAVVDAALAIVALAQAARSNSESRE